MTYLQDGIKVILVENYYLIIINNYFLILTCKILIEHFIDIS